jgi:hypothetical protein
MPTIRIPKHKVLTVQLDDVAIETMRANAGIIIDTGFGFKIALQYTPNASMTPATTQEDE